MTDEDNPKDFGQQEMNGPLDVGRLQRQDDFLWLVATALLILLSSFIVILGAAFVLRIVVESWPC